jgi:hypothetical protein
VERRAGSGLRRAVGPRASLALARCDLGAGLVHAGEPADGVTLPAERNMLLDPASSLSAPVVRLEKPHHTLVDFLAAGSQRDVSQHKAAAWSLPRVEWL